MEYTLAAFVNLLTLAVGIAIGILLAPRLERSVHANVDPQAAQQANQSPPPTAEPAGPIQVQPGMTIGTIGAYQILSHHIQSDELVVNGIDLLKLEQGEFNLLSSLGVPTSKLDQIVADARKTQLYQVAPQAPPPQVKPSTNVPPR
jgi:hypothetical protein